MVYESTIAFTLDTICPWTYIAKRRLGIALEHVRFNDPPVKFKITYHPYLLHPDLPAEGEDKYQWYLHNKYNDSEENMKKYTTVLQALGVGCGVVFNFGGKIGPTIDAHRIIQYFQEKEGEDCADKIIDSLYHQYFTQNEPPAAPSTLAQATHSAGLSDVTSLRIIQDKDEHLPEVKMQIQEQRSNGVDSVPDIRIEGKRRDFRLQGAKEVDEYVKTLEQIIKESS